MNVRVNAWEWTTEGEALNSLAGPLTAEEILADRQRRSVELISLFTIAPEKTGFEIGSGTGVVAKLLAPHCARLDCSDISESFLATAKETCAAFPSVHFYKIDADYLAGLPSNSYDFGYSLNVFIHFNVYDLFNYLLDVARLLKSGGAFYFDACTIGDGMMEAFRGQARLYRDDPARIRGLLNFTSPDIIARLVKEAGLHTDTITLAHDAWMKVLVTKRS